MATLHVHLPGYGVVTHDLSGKKTASIGWAADNFVSFKDPSVSGRHAEIVCEGETYRLRDLGSANKCWLNGVAVTETQIHDGDSIRFGNIETIFRMNAVSKMEGEATLRGRIIMKIPGQGETVFRCEGPLVTVGWKSDNTVRIQDPSISGHHAQFALVRGQYRLKDLDSTNKTLVNGHAIIEAEVHDGDTVQFGGVNGVFKVECRIDALPLETESAAKALAAQIQEQQAQIDVLVKERESLDFHNKQLSTQLQEVTARNEKMAAEREKLAAQARELDEKLSAETARAAASEQALIKERDALQAAAAEAQSRIAALTQERDDLQTAASKTAGPKQLSEELVAAKMPALAAELPKPPLSLVREDASSAEDPKASLIQIAKPIIPVSKAPIPIPRLRNSTTLKFDVDDALLKTIVATAPEELNSMRRCLHAFIKNQGETQLLHQLLADLQELTQKTSKANLTAVATLSLALEALIDDLMKIPGQINPSSLRTVSQSIDFLVTLLDEKNLFRTREPYSANIIAVDDDADARRIIRGSIEAVNLRVICAEDSKATLAVLAEKKFDLIFIDVGLPEINGFELCTRLRKLPDYKKTPVVFITGAVTVQNRVQSSLSGGNDFIAKPFNLLELGVKALIWIFKSQLGLV